MSRIGKQPIPIPSGVEVKIGKEAVEVKGPKGELKTPCHPAVSYEIKDGAVTLSRVDDSQEARAQHGVAGDVGRLVAHLGHGAGDDVVDPGRLDAGTRDELAQTVRQQVRRQDTVQRAAGLALADRGAYRTDDHRVGILVSAHCVPPLSIHSHTQMDTWV